MRSLLIILLVILSSCSTFSKIAEQNIILPEKGYISVKNEALPFESLTYGDFDFANSKKEYKKIGTGYKPMYKNIILYAHTIDPSYEYYIILGKLDDSSYATFYFKSIKLNDQFISIAISKDAPMSDAQFILAHFIAIQ